MPIIAATCGAKSGTSSTFAMQRHETQADAEADDRDQDRQAHRQQRPEADEQDERGDQQADALGAERGLLGAFNGEARQLDPQVGTIGLHAEREQLLAVARLVVGHGLVEPQRAVGDRAPLGDLARALWPRTARPLR